jgi:hypothetical protein
VGCTHSLYDYVVLRPCRFRVGVWLGLLLWIGQELHAAIIKGSVSRNKDSLEVLSGTGLMTENFV